MCDMGEKVALLPRAPEPNDASLLALLGNRGGPR
jgi:hypothetical protein